jgi:hypothetical protein
MLKPSDSRQFFKTVVGICLIAAPLTLLASALVSPAIKSSEADQLAAIALDPGRYYLFTMLIFVGTALLVPVVFGLMYMVRDRSAVLGHVGGSLAMVGALVGVGDALSQLFIWQMVAPGADRAQMVGLLTRVDNAIGAALVFRLGGLGFVIGMVILAIALYRARAVPAWAAAGMGVGAFLNIAGFVAGSTLLVTISSAVLLLSLGWIGRIVLSGTDVEWARPSAKPRSQSTTSAQSDRVH